MATSRKLQNRLAKYGLAAGAVTSAASGDVILFETAIPIPSGTTEINFTTGLLNFDVTFVNNSFSTQFMSSMGSECCSFSNYYTTYGSPGGTFCVSYAFNSSGQFFRSPAPKLHTASARRVASISPLRISPDVVRPS